MARQRPGAWTVESLAAELYAEDLDGDDVVGGPWRPRKTPPDYSADYSQPETPEPAGEVAPVPEATPAAEPRWPNKVRTCERCGKPVREGKGRPPKLCLDCAPRRQRQQRAYARTYYAKNLRRRLEKRRQKAEARALMFSTWLAQLPGP